VANGNVKILFDIAALIYKKSDFMSKKINFTLASRMRELEMFKKINQFVGHFFVEV